MKYPIPQDWDGSAWTCVQIRWPASQEWLGLLRGLITYPMRGRLWDEDTGVIKDAQAVGWKILDRNFPLAPCKDYQVGEPDLIAIAAGQGGFECCWECCEMPCFDISNLLKIDGGILYAMDACCNWVPVGAMTGAGGFQEVGEDATNPGGIVPEPDYYACGKAKAVRDMIVQVAHAMWTACDDVPLLWVYNVENAVGFDLDNNWVIAGVQVAFQMKVIGSMEWDEDVYDSYEQDQILCSIVDMFDASAAGFSSGMLSQLHSRYGSYMGLWGWITGKHQLFSHAIDAIGRVDFDTIAKIGALDAAAECDCPEWGEIQDLCWAGTWSKIDGHGTCQVTRSEFWSKLNVTWTVPAPGEQSTYIVGEAGLACTVAINYIVIRMTGNFPTADWHATCAWGTRAADPHHPEIVGWGEDNFEIVETGPDYVDLKIYTATPAIPTSYKGGYTRTFRHCPSDTRPDGDVEVWGWKIIDFGVQ